MFLESWVALSDDMGRIKGSELWLQMFFLFLVPPGKYVHDTSWYLTLEAFNFA